MLTIDSVSKSARDRPLSSAARLCNTASAKACSMHSLLIENSCRTLQLEDGCTMPYLKLINLRVPRCQLLTEVHATPVACCQSRAQIVNLEPARQCI